MKIAYYSRSRSYEMEHDEEDGEEGHVRRFVEEGDELTVGIDGHVTIYEMFKAGFAKHAALDCMGTREYVGMEPAKPFPLKKFGETRWRKYSEVWKRALGFGSGLRNLGMKPLEASTPEGTYGLEGYEASCKSVPCTLLIFEDTCEEWETALIGAVPESGLAS